MWPSVEKGLPTAALHGPDPTRQKSADLSETSTNQTDFGGDQRCWNMDIWTPETDNDCFLMHPRSPSRGHNTMFTVYCLVKCYDSTIHIWYGCTIWLNAKRLFTIRSWSEYKRISGTGPVIMLRCSAQSVGECYMRLSVQQWRQSAIRRAAWGRPWRRHSRRRPPAESAPTPGRCCWTASSPRSAATAPSRRTPPSPPCSAWCWLAGRGWTPSGPSLLHQAQCTVNDDTSSKWWLIS